MISQHIAHFAAQNIGTVLGAVLVILVLIGVLIWRIARWTEWLYRMAKTIERYLAPGPDNIVTQIGKEVSVAIGKEIRLASKEIIAAISKDISIASKEISTAISKELRTAIREEIRLASRESSIAISKDVSTAISKEIRLASRESSIAISKEIRLASRESSIAISKEIDQAFYRHGVGRGKSPIALTDLGEEIAEAIDASRIASRYVDQASQGTIKMNAYETQEYCFSFAGNLLADLKEKHPQDYETIARVAFDRGVPVAVILDTVVGIELRDAVLKKLGKMPTQANKDKPADTPKGDALSRDTGAIS